jgi:hypothetical protein
MKKTFSLFTILIVGIQIFAQKNPGDETNLDTVTFEKPCLYLQWTQPR